MNTFRSNQIRSETLRRQNQIEKLSKKMYYNRTINPAHLYLSLRPGRLVRDGWYTYATRVTLSYARTFRSRIHEERTRFAKLVLVTGISCTVTAKPTPHE